MAANEMIKPDICEIYERYIEPLPLEDRLQLIELIARETAIDSADKSGAKYSLLDLEGLGAEIWQGMDAQEYVNQLRDEWDHRP